MQSIDHIQNIILDIKYENALLDKFIEEHAEDLIYDEDYQYDEELDDNAEPEYLHTDVRYVIPPRRRLSNVTKS